jgi:hypothetical protein
VNGLSTTYALTLVGKTADEANNGIYTSTSLDFTVTITNLCQGSTVTTTIPPVGGSTTANTTVYNINMFA